MHEDRTVRIPEAEVVGMSRRGFLRGLGMGAGTVLVAGTGALTWRAVDQGVFSTGEGVAYDAWDVWRSGDGLMALVRPAILAANAHNSQPWLFDLGTDRIDLFADTRRSMGTMDPLRREMVVSLGCALANLVLAARANGLEPAVTLLPDPADGTYVLGWISRPPPATSRRATSRSRTGTRTGPRTTRRAPSGRLAHPETAHEQNSSSRSSPSASASSSRIRWHRGPRAA